MSAYKHSMDRFAKFYAFIATLILLISCFQIVLNKKADPKEQQTIWRIECALGVISEPNCPVDGGWSPWSQWSICRGTCDNIGHRKRIRECNNPPTSKDGIPCNGLDEQIESCYLTNCSVDDFRKCIEGDSIRMGAMRQLEAVPKVMESCLREECQYDVIEAALFNDNTWQISPELIWNSLQCVKHNVGCPVIGEWGAWSSWSACGALCGRGFHWRIRRCDSPPPSDVKLECVGNPLQSEHCEGEQCAIDGSYADQNIDGNWSNWGKWSACSEKCGFGVRRRKRKCMDNQISHSSVTWGTHCRGQHDELEVCKNYNCLLNGSWSGWGMWGPCSRSCGAGRRLRTRSCTRPIPSKGSYCIGPKTELGSCHLMPCEVYSHVVAVFNGDSFLQYDFPQKRSTLFHTFIRFMPLSPHGSLIRRGDKLNPTFRLSLQKWYLCVDAKGSSQSSNTLRVCSNFVIEPAAWHTAMVTISKEGASLRIDDAQNPVHGTFSNDPELENDIIYIMVGEKFHGVIQELVINFIPLDMIINRSRMVRSDFVPTSASNIAYENANIEEAYVYLENDQYLRLPCFDNQNEWTLELTVRPKHEVGIILFLTGAYPDHWLCIALLNMRLKIKLSINDFKSEITSSTECLPDQWLDVKLSKQSESGTIEAAINAGERLHILLSDETKKKRGSNLYSSGHNFTSSRNTSQYESSVPGIVNKNTYVLCYDEFYIGSAPIEYKNSILEEFTLFAGVIASVKLNNNLLDLHSFGVERNKDGSTQLSSRTASISGFYHETTWGTSNTLNLTCLHARTKTTPNIAWWFYLDTGVNNVLKENSVKIVDDGKVLRLIATAENYHRGFYTCRAHTKKLTRNIVTYGVIGRLQYKFSEPDLTTVIAVFTTILLVFSTLTWLVIEGVNDLRNGYGFFRDAHLSPQEQAEAVCTYIDQNIHLYGSLSAANVAKARARRKGRYLAGRTDHETKGIMRIEETHVGESSLSAPDELPALPEAESCLKSTIHEVYRCEPTYVSSPLHGSNKTALPQNSPSSSSFGRSPRIIFSHLLVTKRGIPTSKTLSPKNEADSPMDKLPEIHHKGIMPCSEHIAMSPAKKILNKFRMLKSNDNDEY